jgi:hypothetical protein
MMNKQIVIVTAIFSLLCSVASAQSKKANDIDNYNYEVQFVKVGLQGTILFKIYSYGKNQESCIENAKLNAVKAVIFKGIPGSDLQRPMVSESGAEDKYRDFFQLFFQKSGKYLRFVSISGDGSINPDDRFKVGKNYKIGVVVAVQKADLRKELEDAGIIKKLGDGF